MSSSSPESIALRKCETEPVRTPGRIQSFGALLAIDTDTMTVRHASENAASRLEVEPQGLVGASLGDVMGSDARHALRGAMGLPSASTQRQPVGSYPLGGARFHLSLHTVERLAVVELEAQTSPQDSIGASVSDVRGLLSNIEFGRGVQALLESAVRTLRHFSGFDRVMAYQFLPNGDGEVRAEARGPGVDTYLGLRYPAYDIPPQARAVALAMPFRMIADVDDPHVAILGPASDALDLTHAHLRGASPYHLEYLRNMGVGSTMTMSLIVRGTLWGLFAFHHLRKRRLSPDQRSVCELLSQLLSLQLQQELEKALLENSRRASSFYRALRESSVPELASVVVQHAEDIERSMQADGVMLVTADRSVSHGRVLAEPAARRLLEMVGGDSPQAFDRLGEVPTLEAEALESLAGALVVSLSLQERGDTHLVLFREETLQKVRWAGNPTKTIDYGPHGPRLHPRASFREYQQSVAGRCEPWTQQDLETAVHLREALIEARYRGTELARQQWEKRRGHQELVIAELNHRIKNALALVRSIARQTRESADSLEQFTEAFEQRIAALCLAHDLIGGSTGMQWVSVRTLLRTELQPYAAAPDRIELEGPPVSLRADIAPVVALSLHELTSNAAKYGALHHAGGRLSVTWGSRAGGLALRWRERGLDGLGAHHDSGFGLGLIRRAIPYECGGESDVTFHPDGAEARLWLPHDAVNFGAASTPRVSDALGAASTPRVSEAHRASSPAAPALPAAYPLPSDGMVLIVEDHALLAMEMEQILQRWGCREIWCASTLESARECTSTHQVALAVLDVHLVGTTSVELVQELDDANVPLVIVSGAEAIAQDPEILRSVPRLTKPVDHERLLAAIQKAVARHEDRTDPRG